MAIFEGQNSTATLSDALAFYRKAYEAAEKNNLEKVETYKNFLADPKVLETRKLLGFPDYKTTEDKNSEFSEQNDPNYGQPEPREATQVQDVEIEMKNAENLHENTAENQILDPASGTSRAPIVGLGTEEEQVLQLDILTAKLLETPSHFGQKNITKTLELLENETKKTEFGLHTALLTGFTQAVEIAKDDQKVVKWAQRICFPKSDKFYINLNRFKNLFKFHWKANPNIPVDHLDLGGNNGVFDSYLWDYLTNGNNYGGAGTLDAMLGFGQLWAHSEMANEINQNRVGFMAFPLGNAIGMIFMVSLVPIISLSLIYALPAPTPPAVGLKSLQIVYKFDQNCYEKTCQFVCSLPFASSAISALSNQSLPSVIPYSELGNAIQFLEYNLSLPLDHFNISKLLSAQNSFRKGKSPLFPLSCTDENGLPFQGNPGCHNISSDLIPENCELVFDNGATSKITTEKIEWNLTKFLDYSAVSDYPINFLTMKGSCQIFTNCQTTFPLSTLSNILGFSQTNFGTFSYGNGISNIFAPNSQLQNIYRTLETFPLPMMNLTVDLLNTHFDHNWNCQTSHFSCSKISNTFIYECQNEQNYSTFCWPNFTILQ